MFNFERLTPEAAQENYPALWTAAVWALPDLNITETAIVVSLVVDTCPSCHAANRGCQCWNDE